MGQTLYLQRLPGALQWIAWDLFSNLAFHNSEFVLGVLVLTIIFFFFFLLGW